VAATGVVTVVGAAVLLVEELSPGIGATSPVNVGLVPTIVALGVIGTLNVVDVPLAKAEEVLQLTTDPAVMQLQPLLVKLAGAVTPVGKLTVTANGPPAEAVPTLETVTGKLLV
jgi:hypothetical protein